MTSYSPSLTLPTHQWRAVVAAAGAAPSTHNSQPWRFRIEPDAIHLHLDEERALPVVDPIGREARISCGAALMNVRLALRALDIEPLVTLLPHRRHPTLLATVRLHTVKPVTPQEYELYAAIPRRHSHRHPFGSATLPASVLQTLVYAAGIEGGYLRLAHDPATTRSLIGLIRRADLQQSANRALQAEVAEWVSTDESRRDGVPIAATGPRPAPGSPLAMRDFAAGTPRPEREFEADPLLAVLLSSGDTARDQLRTGQALQRVLLAATNNGAGATIMSAPSEVPSVRAALRDLMGGTMYPQLVLRLGAAVSTTGAPRRPVDDLIDPPIGDGHPDT